MNFNSLVVKQKQTTKNTYMKIEFQNSLEFFVAQNGHKNCLDKSLNKLSL